MGQVSTVGLDLAKSIFQAQGADSSCEMVFARSWIAGVLLAFFADLAPCMVAMKTCAGAHHWGRELTRLRICRSLFAAPTPRFGPFPYRHTCSYIHAHNG